MTEYHRIVGNSDKEVYDRLQKERDGVVEGTGYTPSEPSNIRSIKERKLQWNKLTRELRALEKSPWGDPLSILPPELWLEIFIHGLGLSKAETFFEMSKSRNCIDRMLLGTLVCTRWRDALLATPDLWSVICIGLHNEEDKEDKILTSLALSGSARLRLYIDLYSNDWQEYSPLLTPHSDRITSITVCKHPLSHRFLTKDDISTLFSSLGPLPNLTELHITPEIPFIEGDVLDILIHHAPSLSELRGVWVRDSDSLDLQSRQLQTLSISALADTVIPILQLQTSLKRLYVQSIGSFNGEDCSTEDTARKLETLMVIFRVEKAASKLFDYISRASRLSYLHLIISGSWESLPPLFEIFDELPNLTHLSIDIQQVSKAKIPKLRRSNPTPIRHLSIVSDGEYMHILDALTGSTPWLITLLIESEGDAVYPADFITALTRLETLHINFHRGIDMLLIHVEGLLRLELYISSLAGNASPVTLLCPNLQTLRVLNAAKYPVKEETAFKSILDIDVTPQLEDFDCYKVPLIFNVATIQKLSNLRRLECTESALSTNLLLYCLIMQPILLPRLEQIALPTRQVPWDLLLLFLERRNTLPSTLGVRHLVHVMVFGRPPLPVAKRIVQTLKREFIFTEHQSYKAFSMEVIWRRYMDVRVTGCQSCVLALKECDVSINPVLSQFPRIASLSARTFPFEADTVAWPAIIPEPSIDEAVVDWLEHRLVVAQQLQTQWPSWNRGSLRLVLDEHRPPPLYFGFSAERPIGQLYFSN
ncbi:hypothetical protein PIIN_06721 [Serendipita indica DSM 11827]|uniref:Uncharacterized protein n=1 Tax=Serendipita indica (strain DSM 11827) TaxID=1109443 RepID=G4TN91_SERID|nr:hypothetical protein PIIN_06721 [Serendipita indica DSM 11827]